MKKELIKFELNTNFSCHPELKAIKYEDEVLQGGRVYQNQKGIRNEKTIIRLNEIWMEYEDGCEKPYWNSYVIVEKEIEKERLTDIIKNLYDTNKMILNNSKEAFYYRVKEMTTPNDDELYHQIRTVVNDNSKPDTFRIKATDFRDEIILKAKTLGDELVIKNEKDMDTWTAYFNEQITGDTIDKLLKRLTILKFVDDYVEFQIRDIYRQTIEAIANKLANDLYYMFVQEQEKNN